MARRIGIILLAVLMAVTLSRITAGSAATLPLDAHGSPVFVTGKQRCASGPLTVAPSGTPSGGKYTRVTVSGITGGCSAGGVAVILSNPPHTVLFSGTGTVSGGSFTATSSAFTPPASVNGIALVSLDGWMLPATWAYTPPTTTTTTTTTTPPTTTTTTTTTTLPPTTTTTTSTTTTTTTTPPTTTTTTTTPPPPGQAISCKPVDPAVTATCTVQVTGWNFWGTGYRVDFIVTTTSATPFRWEVRFDLSKQVSPSIVFEGTRLFPGSPVPAGGWWSQWTPTQFTHSNVCSVGTNAQLPIVRLRGPHDWNRNVSASQPATNMGFQALQSGGGPLGGGGIPAC